jgi:membrane-associated PAP2 superfamily phosphatase
MAMGVQVIFKLLIAFDSKGLTFCAYKEWLLLDSSLTPSAEGRCYPAGVSALGFGLQLLFKPPMPP